LETVILSFVLALADCDWGVAQQVVFHHHRLLLCRLLCLHWNVPSRLAEVNDHLDRLPGGDWLAHFGQRGGEGPVDWRQVGIGMDGWHGPTGLRLAISVGQSGGGQWRILLDKLKPGPRFGTNVEILPGIKSMIKWSFAWLTWLLSDSMRTLTGPARM
jgi:hypothetical protein